MKELLEMLPAPWKLTAIPGPVNGLKYSIEVDGVWLGSAMSPDQAVRIALEALAQRGAAGLAAAMKS